MSSTVSVLHAEGVNLAIPQDLDTVSIPYSQGIFDDITIHDFLVEQFQNRTPSAFVIPASIGTITTDYWGFKIAVHLRLTKELGDLRYIPLILISNDSLEEILTAQIEKLGILCTTPGSVLVRNDDEEIAKAIKLIAPISETEYSTQFLNTITINRPSSTGKHSLSNVWGVSRLAQTTGQQALLTGKSELENRTKELYFKYLQAIVEFQPEQKDVPELPPLVEIRSADKKILLIDDEADNGWGAVLNPLFKNKLTCISAKGKSFEEFYKEAKDAVKTSIWDLILLDLRLNPKEDVEGNEYKMASQYSGAKLLTHVKEQNGGNQVIMFTASNKTWNMQELLEMGADGYYVKESPELAMSPAFSRLTFNSFAGRANLCLGKGYLREAWEICTSIKSLLRIVDTKLIRSPHGINLYLDQGFNSLYQANSNKPEFLIYAFLDFYKVIETLNKEVISREANGIYIKGKIQKSRYDKLPFISFNPELVCEITPTQLSDKSIDSFQVQIFKPSQGDKQYYESPTSMTLFCGLMLLRFGFSPSDTAKFVSLNSLRNKVAAHSGGSSTGITSDNVIQLLTIIHIAFGKI